MQYRLEREWKELPKRMNTEQAFYLLLILTFSEYHQYHTSQNERLLRGEKRVDREYFAEVFKDIHDYTFKEAFCRFSSMIDWQFIIENNDIQKLLKNAEKDIQVYFGEVSLQENVKEVQKLDALLEIILELEERGGNYSATPASIRALLTELLGDLKRDSIAELCCGTALSGIALWTRLSGCNERISFYGADIEAVLCNIAKMNLYFHGVHNAEVEQIDLLMRPEKAVKQLFDLVIMDIPRGNNESVPCDRQDFRLVHHVRATIYTDWIFIQDALYRLADNGIAAVLVTTGALIRMNEKSLREQIVLNDWLEAVITLPSNLYPKERTGTELLIFNKAKGDERRGKILFVDISNYSYRAQRNANAISDEGIEIVKRCFRYWEEKEGVSTIQNIEVLDREICSLKPMQYIQYAENEKIQSKIAIQDIAAIMRGSQMFKRETDMETSDEETAYFLNIKDIQDNRICFETAEQINQNNPAWKEKFRIQEDDLLITSKGTAIKMALVEAGPPKAFISGNLTLIRVKKNLYHPYILYEYLNSRQGRRALEQIQSGTTIRILNNTSLSKLKIPEFDIGKMQLIGDRLKIQREELYRKQKRLLDTYQNERERLLKELREE